MCGGPMQDAGAILERWITCNRPSDRLGPAGNRAKTGLGRKKLEGGLIVYDIKLGFAIVSSCVLLCLGCGQEQNDSMSMEPRISAGTHQAAAMMLERQDDLLGAIHQYRKVVENNPENARAYNQMGMLYQKLQRPDEAEKILAEGVEHNPDCAVLKNNLGFCHLLRSDFSAAEEQFRKALELSPQFYRARTNLAITLAKTERLRESVNEFSKVLPVEAAYFNVGALCLDAKEYADAEWAFRSALANNPNYDPAKEKLEVLSAVVQRPISDTDVYSAEIEWTASAACVNETPGRISIHSSEEAPRADGSSGTQ